MRLEDIITLAGLVLFLGGLYMIDRYACMAATGGLMVAGGFILALKRARNE